VAFSPDGRIALAACDGTIRTWVVESLEPVGTLQNQGQLRATSFRPNGRILVAVSSGNTARIWDVTNNKPLSPPLHHRGAITTVAFSSDAQAVLTGSEDRTARLWTVSGQPIGLPLQHRGSVGTVVFSPNGETIMTDSRGYEAVRSVWNSFTGKPLGHPIAHREGLFARAYYGLDGRTFLTVNEGFVSIWELPAPIDADPEWAASWSQVISGTMLDEMGGVLSLHPSDWYRVHKRLEELGGPPTAPSQRDDQLRTWYRQRMLASHRRQAEEFEYRRQWFVVTWYLDRLIAQSPSDGSLLVRRGRAYAELGRLDEAIADCEAALRLKPDQADRDPLALLCNNLVWRLVSSPAPTRDAARALKLAQQAVKLAPYQAFYLNTFGVAQYRAGQFTEAIATLEKCLAAGKGETDAFDLFFLAMARYNLGQIAQARADFDRAVQWRREHPNLPAQWTAELDAFRAEVRALLDDTPAELPADVFAPGPPGRP
jgi:hypothetical protein